MSQNNRHTTPSHSLPVRILAIVLALLTASGVLVYLFMLLFGLF